MRLRYISHLHLLLYVSICIVYISVLFVGIYGGAMLGVRTVSGLAFYDWDSTELVRRIEITPKLVSTSPVN